MRSGRSIWRATLILASPRPDTAQAPTLPLTCITGMTMTALPREQRLRADVARFSCVGAPSGFPCQTGLHPRRADAVMVRLTSTALLAVLLLVGPAIAREAAADDAPQRVQPPICRHNANVEKDAPAGDQDPEEDDDEEAPRALTAIVVTARRLDAARTSIDRGLGATVYELHNETIEGRPGGETGSIGTILGQTPGVTLSGSALTVRGSSAVQVRINDVIVPEAISDPADRLSSRLAETTRFITGSLPAQFGFAPGGVVAVTTKNGLYQQGGQAELFAGSGRMVEPAFEWGGSAGASSLFASASLEESQTHVADVTGPVAKDARREIGGLAFADHVIDAENRVSLILGGSNERQKIGETDLPAGVQRARNAYAVGTLQHSVEDFTVQASLFAAGEVDAADFAQPQREQRTSVGTQVDTSLDTGSDNTLRGGFLLTRLTSHDTGPGAPSSRHRRTSLGLYVGDEWKADSHLTLNAGLRGERLRGLGSTIAVEPRVSAVWESPSGFTAHAGYARYASAPPLGEDSTDGRLADERDDYFDAGAQQKLGSLTLGIEGYFRAAQDVIAEHVTLGAAAPSAFGFARGRFRGVEFSAAYANGPVNAWANLSLSKSQGRTIIDSGGLFSAATRAGAEGRWINLATDRPVSASAGVGWRIGKLTLSGDLLAGSGTVRTFSPSDPNGARASAFATIGLAAVYHLDVAGRPLDLRADLTNLTNAHRLENDAANLEGDWTRFSPGRSILIGVEQSF